ncbi:MAG: type 1 glutamine amidotransferase [Candidatus Dormibacteria bacterium]
MSAQRIRLGHLYPREMSIYGDRGNIISLQDRSRRRGIEMEVVEIARDTDAMNDIDVFFDIDIFFIGGGQDQDQDLVASDLSGSKRDAVKWAIDGGAALLAVCGGYQFLGSHYTTVDGTRLPGLGLVDLRTEAGRTRSIGNVLIDAAGLGLTPTTLVGFENHAGRTYLGPGLQPLGTCLVGRGNNGADGVEGVVTGTVIGTYLHGSLLPKNPHLTDHLLAIALGHRQPGATLAPLAAEEEMAAHNAMARRIRSEGALGKR